MRLIGLGVAALALLELGAPEAQACGWWRACAERPYASRRTPQTYGYRYRGAPWAYGYTSPARVYGDAYAAWPSTAIPSTRQHLRTTPSIPNADAIGLTTPVTSAQGILQGGLPARGPSLFGPTPAPVAAGGFYYKAPAYGYYAAPSYRGPPPDTPSWWLEPRRRR